MIIIIFLALATAVEADDPKLAVSLESWVALVLWKLNKEAVSPWMEEPWEIQNY